jgi:hypothetical protein
VHALGVPPFFIMLRFISIFILLLLHLCAGAQELYVFTNPASNIPAKALVAKLSSKSMKSYHNNNREFRVSPELQAGLTKNLMIAGGASFSNMFFQSNMAFESARLYAKYRFYSNDAPHKHFRAAVFTQSSWSNNPLVYQEFNLDGDNSGFQIGAVGTQLINKFAVSGGLSYVRQLEERNKVEFFRGFSNEAVQYNISMGYLLFPRIYESIKQTNLNLYCEFLGQQNTDLNVGFLDIAPALQLIFNSSARVNLGGRFQLTGTAHRMADRSLFLSFEYYFLNAFK